MKRGDLRPLAACKGVPDPIFSSANSSAYRMESPVTNSCASTTTFQVLAENCGFKVIKEEVKDTFDGHSENNRGATTIIQTVDTATGGWNPKENPASKDVIVVSRLDHQVGPGSKEQKPKETFLVTRNMDDLAPKVDFLDMTDVSDILDNTAPNVSSKKCKLTGRCSSIGQVEEKCGAKPGKDSVHGHKRWPRYKIMKPEQWHAKSKCKEDRKKIMESGKFSCKDGDLSKSPQVVVKGKEYQPLVFKLRSRRATPRILLSGSSSVLPKNETCQGEKAELATSGEKHNHSVTSNNTGNTLPTKGGHEEISDRKSGRDSSQVFSNVNSSCLNPGGAQPGKLLPPKHNTIGGMLSYLRKLGNKDSSRDPFCGHFLTPRHRFVNRPQNNRGGKFKTAEKDDGKNSQILPPAAIFNKKDTRSCYYHQELSPRTYKTWFRVPKLEEGACSVDRENSTTRSQQHHRMSNEAPGITFTEKGTHASAFRLDKNRPQDYNINFNSDDGCDDTSAFNSFIGYYLCELWKNQCLCDVRIKVGNTSFLAHKIVLAAFTDIFCPDDPHQIPTVSFDIPDVSEEAISLILQYLYTSKMEVTDNVLESVYTAASILEIGEITDLVIELLSKPTVQNFEKYLGIRQRIGLPYNIMDVYNDFVLENLLEIEDSPYILGMQLPDMEKLLRDPNVKINCEADIIRVIIKWLKYNPCHRSRHASTLLALVDFDCIGPETLSNIVEQNRHLFDLSSMDIIMGAFKKYALRCKEMPIKDQQNYNDAFKCTKARCCCNNAALRGKDLTGNYSDENVCEAHKTWLPDPTPVDDRHVQEAEHKSRKICAVSPQDIRKTARHYCMGQLQVGSPGFKGCYQNEAGKRGGKSYKYGTFNCRPEMQYTIRQKKKLCDSSNNFPAEYNDLRSRSSSSESKRGQFLRSLNSSKSDTDARQSTPGCDCCSCQEGTPRRKRVVYACGGEPDKASQKLKPEWASGYLGGQRPCREAKRVSRRVSGSQACQRSRSSSLSSGSSLRYNGSSSGSSKRVTFS